MAELVVDGGDLVVELTRGEKVLALHGDVRVPLASVRSVEEVEGVAVHGIRSPGYAFPGRTRIGTWRRKGSTAFAVLRAGRPAVRIGLEGQRFDELLVTVDDATEVARRLRPGAAG